MTALPPSIQLEAPLTAAQQRAEGARAHHQFIEARQRESGARMRACAAGRYSLYDRRGQFIGATPTSGDAGFTPSALRAVAARMAYSEELVVACRLVDINYELEGSVHEGTVALIRDLLKKIGAA